MVEWAQSQYALLHTSRAEAAFYYGWYEGLHGDELGGLTGSAGDQQQQAVGSQQVVGAAAADETFGAGVGDLVGAFRPR